MDKKQPPAQTAEIITPSNFLKAKLATHPSAGQTKEDLLLAKAEAAVQELEESFPDWLADELARLKKITGEINGRLIDGKSYEDLIPTMSAAVIDVKGLGDTLGYPMATHFSASLLRFLSHGNHAAATGQGSPKAGNRHRGNLHFKLINAHVDAICAVVHEKKTSTDDPLALETHEELSALVEYALN